MEKKVPVCKDQVLVPFVLYVETHLKPVTITHILPVNHEFN